jgi:hypothetical protein
MPVQIVRKPLPPREPYRHGGITEGVLFGMIVTHRKTGKVEKDVGLFKSEKDFEEALAVWNKPPLMQWAFRRDPDFKSEESFVQPVL